MQRGGTQRSGEDPSATREDDSELQEAARCSSLRPDLLRLHLLDGRQVLADQDLVRVREGLDLLLSLSVALVEVDLGDTSALELLVINIGRLQLLLRLVERPTDGGLERLRLLH